MSETINVTREQAENGMPAWVRNDEVLRRAWHDNLSFRVDLARAETTPYRRALGRLIRAHYERLQNA